MAGIPDPCLDAHGASTAPPRPGSRAGSAAGPNGARLALGPYRDLRRVGESTNDSAVHAHDRASVVGPPAPGTFGRRSALAPPARAARWSVRPPGAISGGGRHRDAGSVASSQTGHEPCGPRLRTQGAVASSPLRTQPAVVVASRRKPGGQFAHRTDRRSAPCLRRCPGSALAPLPATAAFPQGRRTCQPRGGHRFAAIE